MLDLIVTVPDHCLSFYFSFFLMHSRLNENGSMRHENA